MRAMERFRRAIPEKIRTRAEAKDVAAALFPSWRIAKGTAEADWPDANFHPKFTIDREAGLAWDALLDWALDKRSRFYKRARYGFAEDLIGRFRKLLDDAQADWNNEYERTRFYQRAAEKTARRELETKNMSTDGGGI